VRTLASHADWVMALAWSADGSRLVSGSRDKSAKVFNADTGELLTTYQGHGAAVRGVMFSPDAAHVLSAGTDNQLHRWETAGGKRIAAVPLGGEGNRMVAGPEGSPLVPVADARLLHIDLSKNAIGRAYTGMGDWALVAAWHGNSGRVAGGGFNGEVRIWNAVDGEAMKNWFAKP
jgi:WD40 repeat protein